MMASARESAAERERVYEKLQLSMAALQLDKLQTELDRQAAAEGEDDSLVGSVDMELDSDDLDVDVDDGSGAALVTELAQTHANQGPRSAKRHGVRSVPSSAAMPAKTVMEELEEAAAISSIFAGPAPQSQQFAGHRCVPCCLCAGANGGSCGAIYLTALLCGASALSGMRIPVQRPPAAVEATAHAAPAASPLVTT